MNTRKKLVWGGPHVFLGQFFGFSTFRTFGTQNMKFSCSEHSNVHNRPGNAYFLIFFSASCGKNFLEGAWNKFGRCYVCFGWFWWKFILCPLTEPDGWRESGVSPKNENCDLKPHLWVQQLFFSIHNTNRYKNMPRKKICMEWPDSRDMVDPRFWGSDILCENEWYLNFADQTFFDPNISAIRKSQTL